MGSFPQPPDDAIIPAGSLRLHIGDAAIKPGLSQQGVSPAAPPPRLSDEEMRELVQQFAQPHENPSREGFFSYVKAGGMLGAGFFIVPALLCYLSLLSYSDPILATLTLMDVLHFGLVIALVGFVFGATIGVAFWLVKWVLFGWDFWSSREEKESGVRR